MSADLLRRAAALMREAATVATGGPWVCDAFGRSGWQVNGAGTVFADQHALANDAAHIASWHPTVALAVADLLDRAASYWIPDPHGEDEDVACCCCPHQRDVLKLARAYLGESA